MEFLDGDHGVLVCDFEGSLVCVKQAVIGTAAANELRNEALLYDRLLSSTTDVVPDLIVAGVVENPLAFQTFAIITKHSGHNLAEVLRTATPSEKVSFLQKAQLSVNQVFDCQVDSGDLRLENFVCSDNGKVLIIDFARGSIVDSTVLHERRRKSEIFFCDLFTRCSR